MTRKHTLHPLLACLLLAAFQAHGQSDSTWQARPAVEIGGFLDVFYAFDFSLPETPFRQAFLYNHNRHNEVNLNLGLLRADVSHPRYRASLALQTGTYASDNYAAEALEMRHVFEASVGVALDARRRLWLDAGIFPSHIGFESAVSMDNWTLTRSLAAENSPYFLSGAKCTYRQGPWQLALVVANGWQRIGRQPGNSRLSAGTQVSVSPSDRLTVNWSTLVGAEGPDSLRRQRYFSNLYAKWQVSARFGLMAGFDVGVQRAASAGATAQAWGTPVLIGQWRIDERWRLGLRAEYYRDRYGVVVAVPDGFALAGFSCNLDYVPVPDVACRLEARWLQGPEGSLPRQALANACLVASVSARFSRKMP